MPMACKMKRGRAPNGYIVPPHFATTLRCNDRDNGFKRHNHHLHPTEFIIDAACIDLCQFDIIGHHITDLIQRLFIFAPCIDLPDAAFVECLASFWRAGGCVIHAETPQVRSISIPSSLSRALVQTGSQTISIRTSSTPGSWSRRARISSIMKSMAGQSLTVKVDFSWTMPSSSL